MIANEATRSYIDSTFPTFASLKGIPEAIEKLRTRKAELATQVWSWIIKRRLKIRKKEQEKRKNSSFIILHMQLYKITIQFI